MAASGAIESVVRLGATIVLARLLSPEEMGLVAMVMVIIGLIEFVKDLGLGIVTVQRQSITQHEVSSLFWINVLLGVLFALVLCAVAPLVDDFYGDHRLDAITFALAATLVLSGASVQHEALLGKQMRQGQIAFVRLLSTTLSSLAAVAFALIDFSYWSLVAREVVRSAIFLAGIWWYAKWLPSLVLRVREVSSHLKQGVQLSTSFLLTAVMRQIDAVMVGKYFGAADLGIYRQAQGLVVAPIEQFNAPIFGVTQPGLSSLQTNPERYCRYYQRMVAFVAMVTMPVGVFVAAYSEEFTMVALGPKWAAAAPFVCAFALAMSMRPTVHTCTIVLVTLGRSSPLLALEIAHALLFTLFMFVGLQFSALAVAIAFVVVTVVLAPARIYYSFKDSPVSFAAMFDAIQMSLVSCVVMYLSLMAFRHFVTVDSRPGSLVAGIAVGSAAYLLTWLAVPKGRSEMRTILHDIASAMRRKRGETQPVANQ